MKKQLTSVTPLRAGIVLGILYGVGGLIVSPFVLIAGLLGSKAGAPGALGGVILAVMIPVLYAVAGFVGGIIGAFIYNLVAKWTGGLEFEVRDVPPAS